MNTWIYFLWNKSEVFDRFKEFKALVENVSFNYVQKLPANEFLKQKNIQWQEHKTNIHRNFPLDPKTRNTILIFHYIYIVTLKRIYICIY